MNRYIYLKGYHRPPKGRRWFEIGDKVKIDMSHLVNPIGYDVYGVIEEIKPSIHEDGLVWHTIMKTNHPIGVGIWKTSDLEHYV